MASVRVTITGEPGFAEYEKWAAPRILDALEKALTEEMQFAFRQSQREVPVRTGVLKNSGQLLPVERGEGTVSTGLGYGGAAKQYAAIIHNDRSRSIYPSGGKPGYASDPVLDRARGFEKTLAARIEKALKK